MAIYVKYEGIDGDATQDQHKKWLDVSSVQWGVTRSITTPVGSAMNRDASHPTVSEVTIQKYQDSGSYKLFEDSVVGNKGKKVQIDLVSVDNQVNATYILTNALVSAYSVESSTTDTRPVENISINFTKIEFKFIPAADNNVLGGPVTVGYDLATAKKV